MNSMTTRFMCAILVPALALAACGRSTNSLPPNSPVSASAVGRQTTNGQRPNGVFLQVLHSFGNGQDGTDPEAGLLPLNGTLYGTTLTGGQYGKGIVYRISGGGTEDVLHSFGNGTDGASPLGELIAVGGTIYGTTRDGGTYGEGAVFSITPDGVETVLHSFGKSPDGAYPESALLNHRGTLYGTTHSGGTGHGTVYGISTTGTERVVYNFRGGADGGGPVAPLTDLNGVFYGTTFGGTVFSVTPAGVERVISRFPKGEYPIAGLIDVGGVLVGTTYRGGSHDAGTAFGVTTSGTLSRLHNFGGGADGADPVAGLTYLRGVLYGTTSNGGDGLHGNGTIFSINGSGQEQVVYSFGGTSKAGVAPVAPLVKMNGMLYGTTAFGGDYDAQVGGGGTVFVLTP